MIRKILFILVYLSLLSLGVWQLFRLYWKSNIIKSVNLPVVHLHSVDELVKFNCRNVKIDGVSTDIELYVFAGHRGYHVLSPMLLTNGTYMLVNKGITKYRQEQKIQAKKTIATGILYCDHYKKNWFIKNDPAANTWFTFNTEEISSQLGIKLDRCILWCDNANFSTIQPLQHLTYAITWFLLATIWLIMYIVYNRRNLVANNKNK